MNRCTVAVFAIIFVMSFARCQEIEEETVSIKQVRVYYYHIYKYTSNQVEQNVHSQVAQIEQHCPGVTQKLKEVYNPYRECVISLNDTSTTLCEKAERFIYNCSAPVFKVLDDCLPEQSRGVIIFASKFIYSMIHYLCTEKGESLLELTRDCVWNDLHRSNVTQELRQCEQKIVSTSQKFRRQPPAIQDICRHITGFKSCFKARVEHTCKNNVTQNAFLDLVDAALAPCNDIISK